MPRVICDLPNASAEISGVKFHKLDDGGLISDEISEEQAELFVSIPGYVIDDEDREPVAPVVTLAPTTRKAAAPKKSAASKPAQQPAPVEPVEPVEPAETQQPEDEVF